MLIVRRTDCVPLPMVVCPVVAVVMLESRVASCVHCVENVAWQAPSNENVNGGKDQFYTKLNETLLNISTTREIILWGDFNGHTGKKVNNQVVEPYGETRIKDTGERLIDICESYNLRIKNGYFKLTMIHKYTWEQHTRNLKSITDYIIVKQKSKYQIHDVRVQRDINCGSDHYVVRAKVYLPIRGRASNKDKNEENYEKFMYLK